MPVEPGRDLVFEYRNWKGEVATRHATPIEIRWGSSEWHPEPQWLMVAYDHGKEALRDFALADCKFVGAVVP